MRVQPIISNNKSFLGYKDLSKTILNAERKDLINLAEIFHKSSEQELREITKSDNKAYDLLKTTIDGVITRKKCYIADGSSFCKQKASELDAKTEQKLQYYI